MTTISNLLLVIQGGKSVAISGWRLANAVCRAAQMGVISSSLLDTVLSVTGSNTVRVA